MAEIYTPTEKLNLPDQVASREFCRILRTDKFLGALAIAADETSRTGYETGFNIDLTMSLEPKIEDVVVGGNDSMEGAREIAILDGDKHLETTHAAVLNFHFHPNDSGPIIPSDSDLESMRKSKSGVHAVGQVTDLNKIGILLLIPKHRTIAIEDIETYAYIADTELDPFGTPQSKIQRALQEVGIYSSVFTYQLKNGRYVPVRSTFPDESVVPPIRLTFKNPQGLE